MHTPMKRYIYALVATLLIAITGCSSVPLSGRSQLNLVSDDAVLQSSFTQYEAFIQKSPKSRDQKATQMVQEIGRRIAKATDTYLRANGATADADKMRWEFHLIASDQVNAFCMPGGKIVVYEGILPVAKNADQLATVMSHEVAHAIAKHANERMSQQILKQYGSQVLAQVMAGKSGSTQAITGLLYNVGSEVFFSLPYSRKHEYEADQLGLYLMALAGYDYEQAEQFWINMSGGKASQSDFLSTHPSDQKRIAAIRAELPKVRAFMKATK